MIATKTASERTAVRLRDIKATRYDAASLDEENAKHWQYAGSLSANAANAPEIRRRLRNRARYEFANNCYCRGIAKTVANVTIGTEMRPQIVGVTQDVGRPWEKLFTAWSRTIQLPEKLRTMRIARMIDGEAFALLTTNLGLASLLSLDVQLIECDRVTENRGVISPAGNIDGILLDAFGNPESYAVLPTHPGDYQFVAAEPDYVPAASVLHYFSADRPEQRRGIPEITAALPLFAQLRRYTLAVIAAAETAADYSAILYTDKPADGEAVKSAEYFIPVEIERRMMTQVPDGWKLEQFQAVQPTTTYPAFKQEILNEIARCLNVPYNIAAGNSAAYNYASGRLDHRIFHDEIANARADLENNFLSRIWAAFAREVASLVSVGALELPELPPEATIAWHWDEPEHVDPQKEADAAETRIRSGVSTYAEEIGKRGRDWEEVFAQRAMEQKRAQELGLTLAFESAAKPPMEPGNETSNDPA